MRVCATFALLLMLAAANAWAEKRVALVIGNAAYTSQPRLRGTIPDARAMNAKLRAFGFETTLELDLDQHAFHRALANFERALNRGDVGVLYFSGHGARGERGENYLIPLGTRMLSRQTPTVQGILDMMARASNRVNIIILDACRNLPDGLAEGRGLASQNLSKSFRPVPIDPAQDAIVIDDERERLAVRQRQGNAILFAAAPGELSWEGDRCPQYGGHGCFTGELLWVLDQQGLELYDVFRKVRNGVLRSTRNEQAPWFNVAMTGEFFFNPTYSRSNSGRWDEGRIWRVGEMIPSNITDPREIERFLEIRTFQARRLAETMAISFGEAAWILYGQEAGRLR
ncbi:MAG: caspase family protein [Candidatus Tectomicrobia bacterium]|nr:caspase family protein [Candidatus Tectomicrobia bacterium]